MPIRRPKRPLFPPPNPAIRDLPPARNSAPWIRNRLLEHLPYIDGMLLDFYHLSEHVWDTANAAAVMSLVALRESGLWERWWNRSAA